MENYHVNFTIIQLFFTANNSYKQSKYILTHTKYILLDALLKTEQLLFKLIFHQTTNKINIFINIFKQIINYIPFQLSDLLQLKYNNFYNNTSLATLQFKPKTPEKGKINTI